MNLVDYISLMRLELLAIAAVVVLLLVKVFSDKVSFSTVFSVAIAFLLTMLVACFTGHSTGTLFGGMFVSDGTLVLEKFILVFATILIMLQAHAWLKEHPSSLEFFLLLFSVLSGMFYMISSGNFLMFYLGLEMATLPLAALAAFDTGRIRSSEGAGKMILSSAFSSAILLFGLSIIYGTTGSLDFKVVSEGVSVASFQLLGISFLLVGLMFKISIVPFHLWTADTYEGAPVPVATFLSVVSKGAAVFIFITIFFKVFGVLHYKWMPGLMLLAGITMTVGNLFAMRQTNLKRFLAFSSITQAGYILAALSTGTADAMAAVIYFILIYVFSNIGAFTVIAVVSQQAGKEDVKDFKGLYASHPFLSISMMIALLSLAGVPPMAGFFGKLFLLTAVGAKGMLPLLIVACLNMVISLYYYLKVVKAMFVDKADAPQEQISVDIATRIVLVICIAGILLTGFSEHIYNYIHSFCYGI